MYGKPFQCVYYVHVENKQFVPQFDGKPFCAKQLITDNKITKVVAGDDDDRAGASHHRRSVTRYRLPTARSGPRDPASPSRHSTSRRR